MSGRCEACKLQLEVADAAKCAACKLFFHTTSSCIKGGERRYQRVKDKTTWRCDQCSDDKSDSDTGLTSGESASILKAIAALDSKFDLKFNNVQTSLDEMSAQFKQLQTTVGTIQEENASLKQNNLALRQECEVMAQRITDLEGKVNDLEQYSRVDNIEISGVPVTGGENVYAILKGVAGALAIPFKEEDISIAHRLRGSKRSVHPSIIVRFISRRARDTWLTAAKAVKRKISASAIHPSLKNTPVFINEHLTVHSKMLLTRAKAQVRAGKLSFAWVANNKVLVRKNEGAAAVRINTFADIDVVLSQ